MRVIPVKAMLLQAFRFARGEFATIFRLAWFPLAIHLAVGIVTTLLMTVAGTEVVGALVVLAGAAGAALWSVATVAIYRLVLIDERRPGAMVSFRFGRAELGFVLLALLFGLSLGGLAMLTVAVALPFADRLSGNFAPLVDGTAVFSALLLIPVGWLWARFAMVPPILVLRGRFGWRESWRLTAGGNWWRIAVPLAIVFVLTAILTRLVSYAPLVSVAGMPGLLTVWAVTIMVQLYGASLSAGVLGNAYLILSDPDAPDDAGRTLAET